MSAERLPWGKFEWAAWENDPALALVSMGAQGLWMRLLCLAVKEGGYVLIAGEAPSVEKLARLFRCGRAEVDAWLAELEAEKVFSRTGDGVIYSRRMVRDAKIAKRNRENGSKGGNPKLGKHKETGSSDNQPPEPIQKATANPPVKAEEIREEERRGEEMDSDPDGSARDEVRKADIDRLWALAPVSGRQRSSRKDVERALRAAFRRGYALDPIATGVEAYYASDQATKNGGEYAKGLHRLIENDRWQEFTSDGPLFPEGPREERRPASPGFGPRIRNPIEAQQRAWMADFLEGQFPWNEGDRGPKPGEPGCQVSPGIQREFGVEPAKPQPVGGRAA